MPAILTDKQLNLVARAAALATQVDNALTEMTAISAEAGFIGTIAPATLEGSALKHLTPADVTALKTAFDELIAYMNASNRRDIYRKAKP
jgi:hypothetical protein